MRKQTLKKTLDDKETIKTRKRLRDLTDRIRADMEELAFSRVDLVFALKELVKLQKTGKSEVLKYPTIKDRNPNERRFWLKVVDLLLMREIGRILKMFDKQSKKL